MLNWRVDIGYAFLAMVGEDAYHHVRASSVSGLAAASLMTRNPFRSAHQDPLKKRK
jgi:hypothetical protein